MSNESRTPTEEELRALPRWARVAFAARCARLVQPLWTGSGTVDWAIRTAEQFASQHADRGPAVIAAEAAGAADRAAADRAAAARSAARAAAHAAARAAAAAYDAATFAALDDPRAAAAAAAAAAADFAAAAAALDDLRAAIAGRARVPQEIRIAFKRLREAARHEGWTDETPVLPSFFGPLPAFTGEQDEGEKREPCGEEGLVLTLDVPEGVSDEQVLEHVRQLALAADQCQREAGGHGLEIREVEVEQEAKVPVGGPS